MAVAPVITTKNSLALIIKTRQAEEIETVRDAITKSILKRKLTEKR